MSRIAVASGRVVVFVAPSVVVDVVSSGCAEIAVDFHAVLMFMVDDHHTSC